MTIRKFPPHFLWGVSTSAHQVEGDTNNQWDRWEKANAHLLKKQAELRFASTVPDWKRIRHQAEDPTNYIAASADDFWKLYEQDFDIAQSLGVNTFRFSLEWSRIEPHEGRFDAAAIKHYQTMIRELKKRGMEPFVTLWHWTAPLWFEDSGGWTDDRAPERFGKFVRHVGKELKGVKFWLTLNEPDVYTANSFLVGSWPPQQKNFYNGLKVRRHLQQAHRQAYTILKHVDPQFQIGLSEQVTFYEGRGLRGRMFQKVGQRLDHYHYRKALNHLDFIGLQQYMNVRFGFRRKTKDMIQTDMGWWQNPNALHEVTLQLARYNLPIYITEHGVPDAHDQWRGDYIRKSLLALRRAIDEGADVRGYVHWSLIDNFEWAHGFWPRFGLVAVDRKSLKRRVRRSAKIYAEIVRQNGVEE